MQTFVYAKNSILYKGGFFCQRVTEAQVKKRLVVVSRRDDWTHAALSILYTPW